MNLEAHVLNSVHIVLTTLGSAGNRAFDAADKFEVVVVDEAAQSVEPATLSALQLGSRHAVLVGDPQQLPATIFNVSGKNSKYDRSLFQRLEEAGQPVYMLEEQVRLSDKMECRMPSSVLVLSLILFPLHVPAFKSIVCIPKYHTFLATFSMEEACSTARTYESPTTAILSGILFVSRFRRFSHLPFSIWIPRKNEAARVYRICKKRNSQSFCTTA